MNRRVGRVLGSDASDEHNGRKETPGEARTTARAPGMGSGRGRSETFGNGDATTTDPSPSTPPRATRAHPQLKLESLPDDALPDEIVLQRAERRRASGPGERDEGKGGHTRGRPSYTVQAPGTPFHELDLSEIPWLTHERDEEKKGIFKRGLMRYRRSFFLAGIVAGAAIAWALADMLIFESRLQGLRSMLDDQLTQIGVSINNFDFGMPNELVSLGNELFSTPRKWLEQKDFTVGLHLRNTERLDKRHPVLLLPGIVSTGLEAWSTDPGAFRKRLWGGTSMIRAVATQKDLWIKHLSLDPVTGLDPPGIKVRAAQGLDAASYFVSGYWIWARIIENLAAIGYDINDLHLASYDWRLSYNNLETRDRFFTRTKRQIEEQLLLTGKKTVLVSHSMGSSVALYFMKWAEASGPNYGNGGPDWVERHIDSFVSIAGTFLGVPKAMAALLSGEMRDTVELPPAAAFLLERFFSRAERAALFRTWAGSASMVIKGGEAVWGNLTWAPDDLANTTSGDTHGKLYSFKLPDVALHQGAGDAATATASPSSGPDDPAFSRHDTSTHRQIQSNLSGADAFTWLLQHTPSTFQQMVQSNYSNGIEYDEEQVKRNNQIEKTWANPLEAALPNAPSMKMHCIYGVGKPTERSYWYVQGPYEKQDIITEGDNAACLDCGNSTFAPPLGFPTGRTSWIDTSVHHEKGDPMVRSGVKFSDGDGTVSVHSLGAMCTEGWKRKRYNPAGIRVYTHEILHEPIPLDLRGGDKTGDHVDILGSRRVNEIVLRVAAGQGGQLDESFHSQAREFAKKVAWDAPLKHSAS